MTDHGRDALERLDALALDRGLRAAAGAWRRWRRRIARGEALESDPFEPWRPLLGRTAFQRLDDLPAGDPLRAPLARWTFRLAEQRIDREALAATAHERYGALLAIDAPRRGHLTRAAMLAHALRTPDEAAAWLDAWSACAAPLSGRVTLLWERRAEVARRMGLASIDTIESVSEAVAPAARSWLAATRDRALEGSTRPLAEWLRLQARLGAVEDFPGRLDAGRVAELVAAPDLIRGLELDPGPLPESIGPSSFLRAFMRFGSAWADASAPRHQPFVVAQDPYGLGRRAAGALFGLLACSPAFVRRRLAVPSARARDALRGHAQLTLATTRLAAAGVVLRAAALAGGGALRGAHEELGAELFGETLPEAWAGVLPRLHEDAEARFAGWLLAATRLERLERIHDDDWFRNPRALEQLRAEAERSPAVTTTAAELDDGAAALARRLAELLG
ncbi:MAG: hypothetical protein IT376_22430 [Polyangiaceae bacterium]|nr:hypothetical protein [Polyangiaceae bacterium]